MGRWNGAGKELVLFDQSHPPWSKKARYLGVQIDRLNFRVQISGITLNVGRTMKILQALRERVSRASPYYLECIFKTYVMRHYLYRTNLWIFSIRNNFWHGEPGRDWSVLTTSVLEKYQGLMARLLGNLPYRG